MVNPLTKFRQNFVKYNIFSLIFYTVGMSTHKHNICRVKSFDVFTKDLMRRWGGGRRLSGFLPVQSIYSNFYVVDECWPNFKPEHFDNALNWYKDRDVTLGG